MPLPVAAAVPDNQILWLCRRGMLELDLWLSRFVEAAYADLSPGQRQVFAELLKQEDITLYDWLTEHDEPPETFRALVRDMNAIGKAVGSKGQQP